MWPDGALQLAGIRGLAIACIDDVEDIHVSITIVVISGEVRLRIGQPASLLYHLLRSEVVALVVIAAIVLHVFAKCHGAYDVELGREQPSRLVLKVSPCTAIATILPVVGVSVEVLLEVLLYRR